MSNLELFKGNALVNSDLFKSLMDLNKTLAGGSGQSGRRISLRGGKFRMMVDGEQVALNKTGTLNMVIVNAAGVARTYYAGTYESDNPTPPKCWSHDTRTPAVEVPEDQREAPRCADCPMNVKGSGQGESRACRFSQRLAVVLDGELDTVYQLQVPAASLFGDAKGNDMGLQAYIKFLSAHNTPAIAVMTEVRFDDDSESPKLFFKPLRPLDEEELRTVLGARESDEAKKAITLTVAQTDGSKAEKPKAEKPAAKKPAAEKPKAEKSVAKADEDVGEPEVKRTKAEAAPPAPTADKLADVLSGWDDGDD
jgi:hypothetical protein